MEREFVGDSPSSALVMEMMVMANEAIATFCGENNIPVPFRCQVKSASAPPGSLSRLAIHPSLKQLEPRPVRLTPRTGGLTCALTGGSSPPDGGGNGRAATRPLPRHSPPPEDDPVDDIRGVSR